MLYRKQGYPEEEEILLCSVTKIFHHSVFVNIEDYNKQGLVHISEISAGRIRNLRDYVTVGKKIICKVIKVDKKKGHIDLSLRRVNESQRRKKTEEIKSEQRAEKILEQFAKEQKIKPLDMYNKIAPIILKEYEYIYEAFNDVVAGEITFEELGLDKNLSKKLTKIILEKVKPLKVELKAVFSLKSTQGDGVERIKKILSKYDTDKTSISYLGGGKYGFTLTDNDYKIAEKALDKIKKEMQELFDKENIEFTFTR